MDSGSRCHIHGRSQVASRTWIGAAISLALAALSLGATPQHLTATERGELLLNSAKVAYNEKNYAMAAQRFREYLATSPAAESAASARYGLAIALLGDGGKDPESALEALVAAVAVPEFPERPQALFEVGVILRNQALTGNGGLAAGDVPATLAAPAAEQLTRAAAHFALAAQSFEGVSAPPDSAKRRAALEMAFRARCEQAESLLRLRQYPAAATAVQPMLARVPKANPLAAWAQYYYGYARFGMGDYAAAGKALGKLAPFGQGDFALHVRYLLARSHHLSGERPEATAQYSALFAAFEHDRSAANEKLADTALPADEKRRLQQFVANPPDFVAKGLYYWGILLVESGKLDEAQAKFSACMRQFGKSSAAADAQLQAGICLTQLKKFPEAMAALQTLVNNPRLADQSSRWMAKAQAQAAEAAPRPRYLNGLKQAAATLRSAAEQVAKLIDTDPEAKARRDVILLELGDILRLMGDGKEAAAAYLEARKLTTSTSTAEQAMARYAVALQLAGEFKAAEDALVSFQQMHSRSALAPEVAVRYADNALLAAAHASSNKAALYAQATARYQKVIDTWPGTPHALLARVGLANVRYQSGKYNDSLAILKTIPEPDRTGEVARASYLHADCLLRTLPADADDALSTARTIEQLTQACAMFDGYAIARGNDPEGIDARMKVGYCRQRIAALVADPQEQRSMLAMARRNYMESFAAFPDDPMAAAMLIEGAKCAIKLGSLASAVQYLTRFQAEPLKNHPLANLGLIHLGEAMRLSGRPLDAINLLTKLRTEQEPAMLKDPAKAEWVPLLRYSLAMAYKETGQADQAIKLLNDLQEQYPKHPEAMQAPWRIAQCRQTHVTRELAALRTRLASTSGADAKAAVRAEIDAATAQTREVATSLQAQAEALAKKLPDQLLPQQIYYEAAWCWRAVIPSDIDAATLKIIAQRSASLPKSAAPLRPLDIPIADLPMQVSEQRARASYQAILKLDPDSTLATDVRLELADLHLYRDEHAPAMALLKQILQNDPPLDLADRIRLRLGAICLETRDYAGATENYGTIAQRGTGPYLLHAREGEAEAKFLQGDYAGAAAILQTFVEGPPFTIAPLARDRAILRLAQSYVELKQWPKAASVLELFVVRFSISPLIHEARFALGQARENLKQLDAAIEAYRRVPEDTASELAAKALLRIGACRLQQKRYQEAIDTFLGITYAYDYPRSSATALYEAAGAMIQIKKNAEAIETLNRVLRDYPDTPSAELSARQLEKLTGKPATRPTTAPVTLTRPAFKPSLKPAIYKPIARPGRLPVPVNTDQAPHVAPPATMPIRPITPAVNPPPQARAVNLPPVKDSPRLVQVPALAERRQPKWPAMALAVRPRAHVPTPGIQPLVIPTPPTVLRPVGNGMAGPVSSTPLTGVAGADLSPVVPAARVHDLPVDDPMGGIDSEAPPKPVAPDDDPPARPAPTTGPVGE